MQEIDWSKAKFADGYGAYHACNDVPATFEVRGDTYYINTAVRYSDVYRCFAIARGSKPHTLYYHLPCKPASKSRFIQWIQWMASSEWGSNFELFQTDRGHVVAKLRVQDNNLGYTGTPADLFWITLYMLRSGHHHTTFLEAWCKAVDEGHDPKVAAYALGCIMCSNSSEGWGTMYASIEDIINRIREPYVSLIDDKVSPWDRRVWNLWWLGEQGFKSYEIRTKETNLPLNGVSCHLRMREHFNFMNHFNHEYLLKTVEENL